MFLRNGFVIWALMLLAFLCCYQAVSPDYIGDTTRYACDAVNHAEGRQAQFWEFGHLLWRPWGYIGYIVFGPTYARAFGDTPLQATVRFLIQTNFLCSVAVLLLLLFLLRNLVQRWVAALVVFALSCTASFLDYSHAGTPYIPGLLFSILAICLLCHTVEYAGHGRWIWRAGLAGLSFAFACALWFPYSFTGLGLLSIPYVWPPHQSATVSSASRHASARTFLLVLAGSTVLIFAAGATAKGITNLGQFFQWIGESDNGWTQSKTAVRAITGLARLFWDFGGDTVILKRWLFSDSYNPVSSLTLLSSLVWKLAIFYLGVSATIWALWRARRPELFPLLLAGVPLLAFAVFLFEPSSAERFLPLLGFYGIAFSVLLDNTRHHIIASLCLIVLLAGSAFVNVVQKSATQGVRWTDTQRRIQALERTVRPGALVVVVTFRDDLYRLPAARPLDKAVAISRFHLWDAIEVASNRVTRWRAEFAERAIHQWSNDREVWVSERLLVQRPEGNWDWVEGDDSRIRWTELPNAFSQLEFDAALLTRVDGFRRVMRSESNHQRLTAWLRSQADEGLQGHPAIPQAADGYAETMLKPASPTPDLPRTVKVSPIVRR